MDTMDIDIKRLKRDLMDYFGTAMFSGFPMAAANLGDIDCMTDKELCQYAKQNGFDLEKYRR